MASIVPTPALVTATTTLADLVSGPDSTHERFISVRVTNKTTSVVYYRLFLCTDPGGLGLYRCYDLAINPSDAQDVEINLPVKNGYKLQHRASAGSALDVSATMTERSIS
jgi:hypothetical protein